MANNNIGNSKQNKIQNSNNKNNLDSNQKELLNLIIKFYQGNGNHFMNYDHPNQIKSLLNHLNPNNSEFKKSNYIEDILPYVNQDKKIIKFINSNYTLFNVKITYSISKLEFYSIEDSYKCIYTTSILLIHNNKVLKKDESSIDDINNYDTIFIIEDRSYPDDSYYIYLQNKYQNFKKKYYFFL